MRIIPLKAEKEMEAVKWAKAKAENPKEGVEIEHLGNDINTPYSEFAALKK